MNRFQKCGTAALVLMACAACANSSLTAATQWSKTGVIGPAGGTLTVSAPTDTIVGTSITVPAGALNAPVTIKIGASNKTVVATGSLGYAVDFEPSGTAFLKPVTMTIPVKLPDGLSTSRVAVMAVETDGTSKTIVPTRVAGGLATFQASGFTLFGGYENDADGGTDDGGGCTPSCAGDAACGSSDGCGGTCDANCVDAGCTPTCAPDAGCGSSDGCGGSCGANCQDAGIDGGTCIPTCAGDATCGSSDGCGGTCDANCVDAGCQPVTDTFVIGPPKADLLFIMDVIASAPEQVTVANEAASLLASAGNVDYRIAFTTDNDAAVAGAEFGYLLPCSSCSVAGNLPMVISPSSVPSGGTSPDPATAFSDFLASIPNNTDPNLFNGHHYFETLRLALKDQNLATVDFFRPGAFFAAVTVNADNEDDTSELVSHSNDPSGNWDPAWYAALFGDYFPNPYLFTWNYINPTQTITTTGLAGPTDEPNAVQFMLGATNGSAFNSNDSAWPTAFGNIWQQAAMASGYHTLSGTPSEGVTGMTVTVNGTIVREFATTDNANWTYQATLNAVVFNPNTHPLQIGDQLTVTYPITCGAPIPGCYACPDGGSCLTYCAEFVFPFPYCCGTSCVDQQSDPANCGGCDNACSSPTTACVHGTCTIPDGGVDGG